MARRTRPRPRPDAPPPEPPPCPPNVDAFLARRALQERDAGDVRAAGITASYITNPALQREVLTLLGYYH